MTVVQFRVPAPESQAPMRSLPLLFLAAALVTASRARSLRRARLTVARLRAGRDGVVEGAGPIARDGDGRGAVLLLHGFGDTPQSLGYLAEHLHAAGWTVRAPLLPGHGRTLEAWNASDADEWLAAARGALAALRREQDGPVFLVGQSMGGALATSLAAEEPRVAGLVLLAPYLGMPRSLRLLARSGRLWGAAVPWVVAQDVRSIRDADERLRSLAYGAVSPRLLDELRRVVDRAAAAAAHVRMPVLALYSRGDNRIARVDAERGFAALGAPEKWLVWLDEPGHVVSVDVGREGAFALVERWLGRRGAARRPG